MQSSRLAHIARRRGGAEALQRVDRRRAEGERVAGERVEAHVRRILKHLRVLAAVARVRVLHFTDPGCPWAWSARPAHARLRWRYGHQLDWQLVAIGLSEDTERYRAAGRTPESAVRGWSHVPGAFRHALPARAEVPAGRHVTRLPGAGGGARPRSRPRRRRPARASEAPVRRHGAARRRRRSAGGARGRARRGRRRGGRGDRRSRDRRQPTNATAPSRAAPRDRPRTPRTGTR